MAIKSMAERRQEIKERVFHRLEKPKVVVGLGTCGIAAGAHKVMDAVKNWVAENNADVDVSYTSCVGMCHEEVIVEVTLPGTPKIIYGNMTTDRMVEVLEKHVQQGEMIKAWVVAQEENESFVDEALPLLHEKEFYNKQYKNVLKNAGRINPDSIDEYLANGGYESLEKALAEYDSYQVIQEVKAAGLRGRGGAGFPTGLKWEFAYKAQGDQKYVICNADEGDPGAFMDRSVLEGDPHALIEGMLIAGYAIGAQEGYIYVRAEYPLAIKRLKNAITQAHQYGFLGENILATDFSFNLKIKAGAGAFVCGEETALLASIEGERGMPRVKPPFPANSGLWGKPTNINNVETFANVPVIFEQGSEKYASIGTEKSKGTKVFAVTGKVDKTGLVEVPMGITLREIIFDICGGIKDGKKFKAVQIGGPSGGCLPEEKLDLPIDYDSLIRVGAMMGSGGLVVMDETTCMVDLARYFLTFTQNESCGKCVPCREGTKRMLEILTRITEGEGQDDDIETLERLAKSIKNTALCGLGNTAPNPVLSTLQYFRNEYEAHIDNKWCPAGQCKSLTVLKIDPEKCNGCTKCARNCPVDAIAGEVKQPHVIDPEICTQCGTCIENCRHEAIYKG